VDIGQAVYDGENKVLDTVDLHPNHLTTDWTAPKALTAAQRQEIYANKEGEDC
jgi:hypothetical protein